MDFDVVVVGAGPSGLMLAGELRLAGVRTLVLDRLTEPVAFSKAMGLQARSLEILELRGLAERFLGDAGRIPASHFGNLGVPVRFDGLDTRHPYVLHIPQVRTEALLTEWAGGLGAEIRRGHRVTGLRQREDGVTVQVDTPDGPTEVSTGYLVGCDGGSSTVRTAAGIGFPGDDPSIFVVLADVRFKKEPPRAEGAGSIRRFGVIRPELPAWFAAFPLGDGLYRATVAWFGRPFADRRAAVTEQEVRDALVEVAGDDFGMHDVRWMSRVTDVSRQAETYRSGRVLLAGDSAHVHLPAGGQGLNLGLQDAMNLGWKLGAAVNGWAPPGLLDTYQAERHPAAAEVLRNTRAQGLLMNPDPRYDPLRDTFRELLGLDETNRHVAGMISGLGVRYDLPGDHPMVGRRMPDVDVPSRTGTRRLSSHFHGGRGVLLTPEPVTTGWERRVDTVVGEVRRLAGSAPGDAYLIRPDGYVCWAGGPRARSLRSALATWFGDPEPRS
ncbi:FAD-dependent monooxygenase [Actinomadura kijaniata]|uniref:FAD-dependent monooxygenase n=1 Tax=Actinomadura kijaniata TaxID=46161 RepID=UPI003F1BDEFB